MSDAILSETLAAIAAERPERFDRSFGLADRLLAELGEADLAERLLEAISEECPWEVVADLLGILCWQTTDNGAELMRSAEEWLRAGDDLRRVRIALHMEAYPFLDRAEMERVLLRVAFRLPAVAARCAELIAGRWRDDPAPTVG